MSSAASVVAGVLLVVYGICVLAGLIGGINRFKPYQFKSEHRYLQLPFMAVDLAAFIVGLAVLVDDTDCTTLTILAWTLFGIVVLAQATIWKKEIVQQPKKYTSLSVSQKEGKWLINLNAAVCLLHTGSSFFMAPWIRLPLRCMDVTEWIAMTTWTTSQWVGLDGDQVDCGTEQCIVTQCTTSAGPGLRLETMTFLFHFGSALAHWYFYHQGETYIKGVQKNGNPIRWIEYAITAAIMIVVIMVSCGFTDVWVLLCSACLTAVTQSFGWLAEISVQDNTLTNYKFHIFAIGAFAALPPWIAIMWMFIKSALKSDEIPWFVPAIIFALFALFMCFAIIMWIRLKTTTDNQQKKEEANLTAEKRYVIASLVSKFLLAWLLWGGVFSREANDLQQAPLPPC